MNLPTLKMPPGFKKLKETIVVLVQPKGKARDLKRGRFCLKKAIGLSGQHQVYNNIRVHLSLFEVYGLTSVPDHSSANFLGSHPGFHSQLLQSR